MIVSSAKQTQVAFFGFCAVLVLTWFCYQPATGGAFQLDDVSNLGGLAYVEDWDTATDFVLSGTSGPTGRPLALISFALQAKSWQQGPAAFLTVNILIHLLNAAVLAWFLFRLALASGATRENAALVTVAATSAWVLMPLLATASLLVVQRMTTLSAFFTLVGLGAYLTARSTIDTRPVRALTGMSVSLVVATVLATLSKESGLLLPVFVLVLEATVLKRPGLPDPRHWPAWKAVFLVFPLLLIIGYLASRMSYPEWIVLRRDFGVGERLLTEAQILWQYLIKAVLGVPGWLGIYQDVPAVSRSLVEPRVFVACLAWVLLLVGAVRWRRRFPLFAMAVLWYLAGHLVESTVIPLELYFEHRNYLAIIGPLFAASGWLLLTSSRLRRVATVTIPAFLFLSAYFLYSFASLWGEPSLAARHWALRYPDSVRAVTTLASYQLAEEGPLRTLQTIDLFVTRHPQHAYLRIQELNLLCLYATDQYHTQTIAQLERDLPRVEFTYTAGVMLSELFSTAAGRVCSGLSSARVAALARLLRDNPRYAGDPLYNQFHHKLLAGIARHQGDDAGALEHLRHAIEYRPSSELNMMMVTALGGSGDFDAAYKFIDDAQNRGPANPLRAAKWRRDLDGLRAYIRELESSQP